MKCKISILCFLLLFINRSLHTQNDQFQFSHLDINNGLSHNQINCILKDSKGFMWFGTPFLHATKGIYKYDALSRKVTHLVHNSADDNSIYSNANLLF
jgi:ligand-binding sensor domain-containing protein